MWDLFSPKQFHTVHQPGSPATVSHAQEAVNHSAIPE
ncbi:hypothetical protein JMUB5695_02348 [Mycobacterium heckeshornense]|nr:hypothetical protein JMUB5695_02348 [Mycobacterium heckeshornense]